MDRRPKLRKWDGEDYDSDPDEGGKANSKFSNVNAHMREIVDDMEEEKPGVHPPSCC